MADIIVDVLNSQMIIQIETEDYIVREDRTGASDRYGVSLILSSLFNTLFTLRTTLTQTGASRTGTETWTSSARNSCESTQGLRRRSSFTF
jgi:hypothetical protein